MKTIKSEWITLWNAIKSLLGDKPLMTAIVGLLVTYLVARDPSLSGQSANIQNTILVIAGLIVGTYKIEDIIQAIASVYSSKAVAALNANTQATLDNTKITGATLRQNLTEPPPSFLSDAHAPQQPDPARAAATPPGNA